MTNFNTAYSDKPRIAIDFSNEESLTKQSFKDECDINNIMSKYQRTGMMTFVNDHSPLFGDIPSADFKESMDIVLEAQEMFSELPSKARKYFDNDPEAFLKAVESPDFYEKLYELGLTKSPYQPQNTPSGGNDDSGSQEGD